MANQTAAQAIPKKTTPAKRRTSAKAKAPAKAKAKAPAKAKAKAPAKAVPPVRRKKPAVSKAQAAADKRAREKALAEELEAASHQVLAAAGVEAEVTWTEPPNAAPTAEIELTLDEEQPEAPFAFNPTAPVAPVAQLPVAQESLTLSQELRAEAAEIQRAIRLLQPEEAQALLDRIIPAREEIDALKAERLEEVGRLTEAMQAIRGQIDRKLDQVKLAQTGEAPQPVDPFRALGQIDRHWRRLGTLEDQRAELRKQYAAAIKDAERTYRAHLEGIRQRELPFGAAVA